MKLVYIAHPLRGDLELNLRMAARWVRWAAVEKGVCPVAPYIAFCAALDDHSEEERKLGMELDLLILERCDELWLCGPHTSDGMKDEARRMRSLGRPVSDLTGSLTLTLGQEIPDAR